MHDEFDGFTPKVTAFEFDGTEIVVTDFSAVQWFFTPQPARELTEDDKAIHRAIKHHQP